MNLAATPLARLTELVDRARSARDGDSTATAHARDYLHAYLSLIEVDAEQLRDGPEVRRLLLQLENVHGWGRVAKQIGRIFREQWRAKGAHLQLVRRGESIPDGPDPEVVALLQMTRSDTVSRSMDNVLTVLTEDDRWSGRLRLNEFSGRVEVYDEAPDDVLATPHHELTSVDVTEITAWMAATYRLNVASPMALEGIQYVASKCGYHPVRAYLNGLEWDGVPRVSSLFDVYMGAETVHPPDDRLAALRARMSQVFLIAAVARVMPEGTGFEGSGGPGCKVDTVPILQGTQGAGKSTGVAALVPDRSWFSDSNFDPTHNDAKQFVHGCWLIEIAEIDKWGSKKDQSTIKNFISSPADRYRPPYGHVQITQPRQCVFIGTTNAYRFLADRTGSRRYHPVRVGDIDVAAIAEDRDQLWAEAVHLYHQGVTWWLTREESDLLADASEDYQEEDPWRDMLAAWVLEPDRGPFRIDKALSEALQLDGRSMTPVSEKRAGMFLRDLGCISRRERLRTSGAKVRVWLPPHHPENDGPE